MFARFDDVLTICEQTKHGEPACQPTRTRQAGNTSSQAVNSSCGRDYVGERADGRSCRWLSRYRSELADVIKRVRRGYQDVATAIADAASAAATSGTVHLNRPDAQQENTLAIRCKRTDPEEQKQKKKVSDVRLRARAMRVASIRLMLRLICCNKCRGNWC